MKQIRLFFLSVVMSVGLHAEALPEYTLKAAYLYNFALLTDWPNSDQSGEFNMCFYREDFGSASTALQNKMIGNRKVKITTVTTSDETKGCQMIFIRKNDEQNGARLINRLAGIPILIVSETPGMNDAHITIVDEGRKLAFDISLKTLKHSNLSLSSRLLKLARRVEP